MLVERLTHGKDLLSEIEILCGKRNVESGWFNVIGALKNVTYGFYDQDLKRYEKIVYPQPCEITSCIGNISILGDKISVHAHVNFADREGSARGGHLYKGEIFAAEIMILPHDKSLKRKFDRVTGLNLWS